MARHVAALGEEYLPYEEGARVSRQRGARARARVARASSNGAGRAGGGAARWEWGLRALRRDLELSALGPLALARVLLQDVVRAIREVDGVAAREVQLVALVRRDDGLGEVAHDVAARRTGRER